MFGITPFSFHVSSWSLFWVDVIQQGSHRIRIMDVTGLPHIYGIHNVNITAARRFLVRLNWEYCCPLGALVAAVEIRKAMLSSCDYGKCEFIRL